MFGNVIIERVLTTVDLSYRKGSTGHWWMGLVVKGLKPEAHSGLGTTIVPDNVAQCCAGI
jgi:hypothetical protein